MTSQTATSPQLVEPAVSGDIVMTAEIEILKDNLILDYHVKNRSESDIYLVNQVYKWTKTGLSIEPEFIYTEISNNTLHLIKANVDIPKHVKIEAPDVPYLTLVKAQSEFTETVSLTLPILPFHPYGQAKFSDTIQTFSQLKFVLGWLPSSDITVNIVIPTGLTLLSAKYQDVIKHQRLLTSTFEIEVPTHIQKTD